MSRPSRFVDLNTPMEASNVEHRELTIVFTKTRPRDQNWRIASSWYLTCVTSAVLIKLVQECPWPNYKFFLTSITDGALELQGPPLTSSPHLTRPTSMEGHLFPESVRVLKTGLALASSEFLSSSSKLPGVGSGRRETVSSRVSRFLVKFLNSTRVSNPI